MSKFISNKKLFISAILLVIVALIGITTGAIAVSAKHTCSIGTVTIQDWATKKIPSNATNMMHDFHSIAKFGYFGGISLLVITSLGVMLFTILITLSHKGNGGIVLQNIILISVVLLLLFTLGFGISAVQSSYHIVSPEWRANFIGHKV